MSDVVFSSSGEAWRRLKLDHGGGNAIDGAVAWETEVFEERWAAISFSTTQKTVAMLTIPAADSCVAQVVIDASAI